MGIDVRHSGHRAAVSGGIQLFVGMLAWLAWGGHSGLRAQAPYSSASGESSTYAFYDPLAPPVPKAPGSSASLAPYTQGTLPVVSADQYAAIKAAIAPYSQASFSSPPAIQITPSVIPRAPGTVTGPIVLTPAASFPGIQEAPGSQQQPPSPDIAAGPSDVVMVINSYIAQYTKTGTQVQLTAFQDFFSTLLPTICPTGVANCQIFDPCIRYDQLHGRFVFLASSRTYDLRVAYNLISVSNGATYKSGWKTWALNAGLDGTTPSGNWADFWRLGFDNTAVYLSGNMYSSVSAFQYAKIRVLLKSNLYNLTATTLPYQDLYKLTNVDGSLADSIIPVHQRGKPSAVNSQVLVNATTLTAELPASFLTVWKIADPTANPVVAKQSAVTGLVPYSYPASAPQLSWPAVLDSGDSRVLKAVYRDGFLYTARDTGYTDVKNAATTVTFDVIDTTKMALVSQARLLNANSFYPAFDVPATVAPGTQFAAGRRDRRHDYRSRWEPDICRRFQSQGGPGHLRPDGRDHVRPEPLGRLFRRSRRPGHRGLVDVGRICGAPAGYLRRIPSSLSVRIRRSMGNLGGILPMAHHFRVHGRAAAVRGLRQRDELVGDHLGVHVDYLLPYGHHHPGAVCNFHHPLDGGQSLPQQYRLHGRVYLHGHTLLYGRAGHGCRFSVCPEAARPGDHLGMHGRHVLSQRHGSPVGGGGAAGPGQAQGAVRG